DVAAQLPGELGGRGAVLLAQEVLRAADDVLDAPAAELVGQRAGGDLGNLVGLVDDHAVVLAEHRHLAVGDLADLQVGHQHRGVGDDDVGDRKSTRLNSSHV